MYTLMLELAPDMIFAALVFTLAHFKVIEINNAWDTLVDWFTEAL